MSTPASSGVEAAAGATAEKVSTLDKVKSLGIQLKEKARSYIEANPEKVEEMKAHALETLRKKIDEEAEKEEEATKRASSEEGGGDGKKISKGEKFKAKAVGVLKPQIDKLAEKQQQIVTDAADAAAAAAAAAVSNESETPTTTGDDENPSSTTTTENDRGGCASSTSAVSRSSSVGKNPSIVSAASTVPSQSTEQDLVSKGSSSTYKLASGYDMPVIAYGTFRSSTDTVYKCVLDAIDAGYRHFDCAHIYGNEKEIGMAFQFAFSKGIVTRDDLFITGKLWNSDHDIVLVEEAIDHSLSNLGLEYFDLYLIHFPVAWKHTGITTPGWGKSELGDTPLIDTWREMERCVAIKKCRSIGVSNYPLLLLHDLVNQARVPVSCNQIETHAYYTRESLVKYCLSRHICVAAHSPLGGGKANEEEYTNSPSPLEDPIVMDIATSHNITPAQVLLRFLLQSGIVVLPKSVKASRMKENIQILSSSSSSSTVEDNDGNKETTTTTMNLSDDDMAKLRGLDKYVSAKTNPNPLASFLEGPDCFTKDGTDIFD